MNIKIAQLLIITLISMLMISCAAKTPIVKKRVPGSYTINGKTYYPLKKIQPGYSQRGIASWYGPGFHGKKTASGEVYDMHALTAAHSTLPLQTLVQVTNLTNRKSVLVRVNDRGPFVGERVIDLSFSAAQELDIVKPGTAPVHFTVIGQAPVKLASKARATPAKKSGVPPTPPPKLASSAHAPPAKKEDVSAPNPFFTGRFNGLLARLMN
ncbi:MAG: septal ring lytic transglycosylase RlpA family protein [Desulfomonilaceae bacterium]|nr:septal ring lytic transglycosylase RlpA family protein [Desulfomonilaceae bacterium]